jgi:hypothetical protein
MGHIDERENARLHREFLHGRATMTVGSAMELLLQAGRVNPILREATHLVSAELVEITREIARLRRAYERYAQHDADCTKNVVDPLADCDCGEDAVALRVAGGLRWKHQLCCYEDPTCPRRTLAALAEEKGVAPAGDAI